jgi:hypothetical protein
VTIIATDGNCMAADSVSFQDDIMHAVPRPKIVRAPDGTLVGATGATGDCSALRDWVVAGMNFEKVPLFSFRDAATDHSILWLWLRGPGDVHMGDCTMAHWAVPVPTAIGFGVPFLHGLLVAGMMLGEAVAITIKRSAYLGGDMQIEELRKALSEAAD